MSSPSESASEARRPTQTRTPLATAILAFAILLVASLVLGQPSINPKNPRHVPLGELTNPLLSPEYAQWLVGPASWLLSEEEIERYLFLTSDSEARAFIDRFWEEHQNLRRTWDMRVAEADKKFRERTVSGSKTDRGIIWVLYGEPDETEYEEYRNVLDGNVELWTYPKGAEKGLDGREPRKQYRFVRDGDLTIFYQKDLRRDARRRFQDNRGIPPGWPR